MPRLDIIKLREDNPCMTLQQIGDRVGVTREAVRQALKASGKTTRHFTQRYICLNCQGIIPNRVSDYYQSINHLTGGNRQPLFCSAKCRHEYAFPLMERGENA